MFPRLISLTLTLVPMLAADCSAQAAEPNILLIVADDLGWADVGYHGSPIKTPNIDRLCRNGVELDQHYVAPMCTPTRAALLTGRYWSRFGNTSPNNERVLPWHTVTLARALRQTGYDTCITGKWHLGSKPEWGPRKFGFNHSHGSLAGGVNPWNHLYKHGPYSKTWHRNDRLIEEEGHVTDLIMREAIGFVEAERDGPFFVYVPFTAVHIPFDEPERWLQSAADIHPDRRQYAACAQHMDFAIGKIVHAIEQRGLLEDTLIVFFSDNGGSRGDDSARYPDTVVKGKVRGLNTPLRGWKGQVYEGGIRTPAFVHWPKRLKSRKVTAPLHVIDWMPTLCGLVGFEPAANLKWDGRDIWPILTGQAEDVSLRTLYTQRRRAAAIRQGDWKLVVHRGRPEDRIELFNVADDPNEEIDLAAEQAELVKELQKVLAEQVSLDNDAVPNR